MKVLDVRRVLCLCAGMLAVVSGAASQENGFRMGLPLDCVLGETCFLQNYVDIDPGPGRRDYACGQATYDGHKGTDFRALSVRAARGMHVLAVADGKVLRERDDMPDKLLRDYASREEMKKVISGRDCGNGMVIDHGSGWTTQYCHLRRGSLMVKPGQAVKRGDPLGLVGYSGRADFAHVHITVRHNDTVIDPFSGRKQDNACGLKAGEATGLWVDELRDQMRYGAEVILGVGFTGKPPTTGDFERDHSLAPLEPGSNALILFARMMNMRAGDRVRLSLRGPNNLKLDNTTKPLKRSKATQFVYLGRKRKTERWPSGQYRGGVAVIRRDAKGLAGRVIATRKVAFDLP